LEGAIGGSARFWMARERTYRDALRQMEGQAENDNSESWLSQLPLAEMIKWDWLPPLKTSGEKASACLRFFGVGSIRSWSEEYQAVVGSAVLRRSPSFEPRPGAVAAWLRRGELESAGIETKPWDKAALRARLPTLRGLTRVTDPDLFVPELRKVLAECGVTVVIVRAPTGCYASGATRFVTPTKALMLLSFRYLSDDQFWFSVFHEVGHLLLHPPRLFLDGFDMVSSPEEVEANRFAADTLLPPEHQAAMMALSLDGRAVM